MSAAHVTRPIVVVGPTAGGKSDFAVALAEALQARAGVLPQIVNADSMQVYRHMDAGTAKPSAELRRRVPHHLIDIVEPTERFTVADWLQRTEALLAEFRGRGVTPILVGGTNLYLKVFLEGMFAGPAIDPALRNGLEALDNAALHARLAAVDPVSARRIHPNDRKKMVRALEVFELTGRPISSLQREWTGAPGAGAAGGPPAPRSPPRPYRHDPVLIGLDWPVEAINRRINARVKAMFHPAACGLPCESLPEEARRLEAAGRLGPQARLALGYKQVLEHLAGRCSIDDAFEATKVATRRFAKQQRTWLKRYQGVRWLPAAEMDLSALVATAVAAVPQAGPPAAPEGPRGAAET